MKDEILNYLAWTGIVVAFIAFIIGLTIMVHSQIPH